MVQLKTQRTALILYGVLLVLPTLVLGGLQWNQLLSDYASEHQAVPQKAEEASGRLRYAILNQVDRLIETEARRPFTVYGSMTIGSDVTLAESTPVTSPLVDDPRPQAILAWFAFDLLDLREAHIDLWGGANAAPDNLVKTYEPCLHELLNRYLDEQPTLRLSSRWDEPAILDVPLLSVVFNRLHKRGVPRLSTKNCR